MTTTDRDVVHLVGNGVTESRSDGNINYRGTVHFHSKGGGEVSRLSHQLLLWPDHAALFDQPSESSGIGCLKMRS